MTALPRRRWLLDLGVIAALLLVGIVGWWPTFGGPVFLVATLGALVLGLAIAALTAWRGWGILVTAALTIGAYFVFGSALALPHLAIFGVIPSLESLRHLAFGVIVSWKQLLTTVAPVAASDGHLIAPFLLVLVLSVLAASLALRLRQPAWALIPAALHLILVIALGTPTPAAPVAQGIVFGAVVIAWLAVRQLWAPQNAAVSVSDIDPGRAAQMRLRRLGAGAAVLAVAVGAGVATSAVAAPVAPRQVFRDTIIPPFDIRQYASPLQSFRGIVQDQAEETLFTVRGLPEGGRVRLGAMDAYNGIVYNVSDRGVGSSGAFSQMRGNMSADARGIPATLEVTIDEYNGFWLPVAGQASEFVFGGERAEELRRNSYYNESSSTAVSTRRLAAGDSYTLTTTLPEKIADARLAKAEFGHVSMPKQSAVPEEIAALAAETVADAETPIEQVRALEVFLSEEGFFSHGLAGEVISRAGHTSERISTLLGGEQMVGDDEQYAVAMTLLAREIGIPARVVMGFYPAEEDATKETFVATGDTLHAWVEVNFAKIGWVPFDPTPPDDKVPADQSTKPKVDPKPQVLQPPPPPQEPVDLPPTLPDERESEDGDENPLAALGIFLVYAAGAAGILLLLLAPFILIGAWKAAKRRSRRHAKRSADQISGGWDELTDRAVDYGARVDAGATRGEEAHQVAESLAQPAVLTLASRADGQVFGPAEPSPAEVEEFWREVDSIVGDFSKDAGFLARVRARLSVRSLTAGTVMVTGWQNLRNAASARTRSASEPGDAEASAPGDNQTKETP